MSTVGGDGEEDSPLFTIGMLLGIDDDAYASVFGTILITCLSEDLIDIESDSSSDDDEKTKSSST